MACTNSRTTTSPVRLQHYHAPHTDSLCGERQRYTQTLWAETEDTAEELAEPRESAPLKPPYSSPSPSLSLSIYTMCTDSIRLHRVEQRARRCAHPLSRTRTARLRSWSRERERPRERQFIESEALRCAPHGEITASNGPLWSRIHRSN